MKQFTFPAFGAILIATNIIFGVICAGMSCQSAKLPPATESPKVQESALSLFFPWQDPSAKEYWEENIQTSQRLSLHPRMKHVDAPQAEGHLEAFGTRYMPDTYARYQEARTKALELELLLKESFPKGKDSDPTGGTMFEKANKNLSRAVAQMFRRRDELCFCLLFHHAGIFSEDALTTADTHPLTISLEEESSEWPDDTPKADMALDPEDATFAAKYLPETHAGYTQLCRVFNDGAKQYSELRQLALVLDAPRARRELFVLKARLEEISECLTKHKNTLSTQRLAHALGETTAESLAALDQSTAVQMQEYEQGMELRNYVSHALTKLIVTLPRGVTLEMIGCPPGTFTMGNFGESQNQVTLTKGFWICKYECTYAVWEAVMGGDSSWFRETNKPVTSVSWNDCQKFLGKLNALPSVKNSGWIFRLPTEEEWEYACRAGSKKNYCKIPGGREITKETLEEVAWYDSHASYRNERYVITTYPVGKKKPNAWGLYDMLGNVQEWTSTSVAGNRRVYRGGSSYSSGMKASDQGAAQPDNRGFFLGFRFVAIEKEVQAATERKKEEAMAKTERKAAQVSPEVLQTLFENMVEIPEKKYRMCKYEVTQALWEAVMADNPSRFKGADHPVECVSWNDCQKFLEKLNALPAVEESGLVYRLPMVKEWEHACRAGSKGSYCKIEGGREITEQTLEEVAWYDEWPPNGTTHPVGEKKPNAWGIYDMHGNVREWTSDFSVIGACFGGYCRVNCGGSRCENAWNCRLGDLDLDNSDRISSAIGLRLIAERR